MTPEESISNSRINIMLANPGIHVVVMRSGITVVEVDEEGRCYQCRPTGAYERDGELARDRWVPELVAYTIGPFARQA